MPRPQRRFHTNSKKHKKVPETADDFLSAGIEYEESGDRWRPGDKLKAGRFYLRAIEAYQACLLRDPASFDAAYNKARLHYQLAEQPELLPDTTRESTLKLLETALQAHQLCTVLSPNNEDALFNTAQVFTSLAEFWIDFGRQSPDLQAQTITYLTSAIDLFQKCLNLQQQQYDSFAGFGVEPPSVNARPPPKASQDDTMDMDSDSEDEDTGGVSLSGHHEAPNQSPVPAPPSEAQSETALSEYAHVVEPVTLSTLLDTTLALLHAYTLILPLIPTASDFSAANDAVEKLLKDRLEPLSNSLPEREPEIALDLALLRCAQSEARWRSSFASLADWSQTIASAPWPSSPSTSSLTAKADAHIALAEAALESQPPDALMSWKHFSFASAAFGEATKLEPTRAELYLARGDAEMMRSRIDGVEAAVKSRAVLRKNAGVYYRGAMKLGEGRVKLEGDTKDRMIKYEDGDESAFTGLDERAAREVVEDAIAEGVFGAEWLDRVRETEVAMDE